MKLGRQRVVLNQHHKRSSFHSTDSGGAGEFVVDDFADSLRNFPAGVRGAPYHAMEQ